MAIWNNQTVSGVERHAKNWLGGFKAFILRGNVVDLAVGIVIGAAFTAVVNGLVSDIITPLIPVAGTSLSNLAWTPPYTHTPVNYCAFINFIISFLMVAFVVYIIFMRSMNSLMARIKVKEVEAPP